MMFGKDNKISFKDSMRSIRVPVITLMNDGVPLNFIVDTGATTSLINSNILNELNVKSFDDTKDYVYGLNPDIGYTAKRCIIELSDNNTKFDVDFNIIDLSGVFQDITDSTDMIIHGLLGVDFLETNGYILDFVRYIAYHK